MSSYSLSSFPMAHMHHRGRTLETKYVEHGHPGKRSADCTLLLNVVLNF